MSTIVILVTALTGVGSLQVHEFADGVEVLSCEVLRSVPGAPVSCSGDEESDPANYSFNWNSSEFEVSR